MNHADAIFSYTALAPETSRKGGIQYTSGRIGRIEIGVHVRL